MLDIKFILENPELIEKNSKHKNVEVDVKEVISKHQEKNKILQQVEELRAKQNSVSKEIPSASPQEKQELLTEMSKVKEEIKSLEPKLQEIEKSLNELLLVIPNPILSSVPIGKDEEDNEVIKTHLEPTKFNFTPKDHMELGKNLDIIDIERGVRTSGSRFYYLKNEAVQLEFALFQHALNKLISKGFSPIIPPVLVKEDAMYATGFFPADRNEIYNVNPQDDNLFLVGTSEVPLTMLHYTETLKAEELPLRYCGFSPCFRREAGSYGKDVAGILRVHQFNKLEMFSFCHPDKSEEEHEFILSIEEEIMQDLKLPYQVINICSGDLGAPAAKKYDIEVWIPTQEKYRELTSCSNCTDFQARRAKIKYKEDGKKDFLHTLNGTTFADTRTIIAILENYQNEDGSVTIPEVLRPYFGGKEKIEK